MSQNNYNDSLPAAPADRQNAHWSSDPAGSNPRNVSVSLPDFIGDSGGGGKNGAVPAPAAGDAANGRFLSANGNWVIPAGGSGDSVGRYAVSLFLPGAMVSSSLVIIAIIPDHAIIFPVGLTRSTAMALSAATGSTVISAQKNGIQFGTITFAPGGTIGTFAAVASCSFNGISDVLSVVGPASADATLANIGIVLAGTTITGPCVDEDYWMNPVSAVWATRYRQIPFPDPEEIPAGSLV